MTRLRCGCAMIFSPVSPTEAEQKEKANHEEEIPGSGDGRNASDDRSRSCVRARGDPGGKGEGAAIPGNDEEKCVRGYERPFRSAMELQAGAGPVVGGASDGTYRGGGGLYPGDSEGKSDDLTGRRTWPGHKENR